MAISGAVLGPTLVVAAGSTDPVGIVGWTAIGAVIGTWLITGTANPLLGDPLIAAGPVIAGTGKIAYADVGSSLALPLAAAAGSVDAVGLVKWGLVGVALATWIGEHAQIDTTNMIAFVGGAPPGAVTGIGGITFDQSGLGVVLAIAAGSVDPAGAAKWLAVGAAIEAHMSTLGTITAGSLVNPGTGGPVTGTGAVA